LRFIQWLQDQKLGRVSDLALELLDLSPRELAIAFTDEKAQFISEASVYRLLRANGLLTSSAFIVMKATDELKDKTTAPNQLWQMDFTYLKVKSERPVIPCVQFAPWQRLYFLPDPQGQG